MLDLFPVAGRGTAVVVEIIDGAWQAGALLVSSKGTYRIGSIEGIDGKNLPATLVALVT